MRDERWQLLWYPKIDCYQFFDLFRDPRELDDLSGKLEYTARLAELKKRPADEQEMLDDPLAPDAKE